MSKYIDAEEFAERADRVLQSCKQANTVSFINNFLDVFTVLLASEPTADVEEVKHGKWLIDGDEHLGIGFICSSCGKEQTDTEDFRYCPWCGAKMDL